MYTIKVKDLSVDEIVKSQTAGYQKKPHELGFIRTTRVDDNKGSWHGTVNKDGTINIK